ncbi:MAG: DivIVA domain-containing protein [Cellulosilyticum sp.]|nr:DivIVA domain-containing protein [Cellulosilyticum sp.]
MLSVVDIQNKEFKKSKFGGYSIDEVNDYLEQIIKSYQEVLNENYALKDKVNVLNESVQYYRTMESTIQNVLVLADKTAQDTKAAAYDKAEQIKKEADERAEKITALAEERVSRIIDQGRQEAYELGQKVEETKRQYIAYKTQFKQLIQAQADFLDQGDVRMNGMHEELTRVFEKIQEETEVTVETKQEETIQEETIHIKIEEQLASDEVAVAEEEDTYYTKAYVPISSETHME